MEKTTDTYAVKIVDDLWWLGFADYEAGFSNNPYLLIDEDEAVLFDPGPGHPIFRDIILQKIQQVINPIKIKYIVVHHADPDLCGLIPFIEKILHPNVIIIAHPRTALFIPYYGIRKNILPIGDENVLELKSGRKLTFYHTPYVHFAGSMITYDEKSGAVFSSDIFASFDREWKLYADKSDVEHAKSFIENYVWGKQPIKYVYNTFKKLKINLILPQHGGIIKKEFVKFFLNMLRDVIPGQLLTNLERKLTDEQEKELLKAGKEWLEKWTKRNISADSLNDLAEIAISEGPSTFALLLENLDKKAKDNNVFNPMGSKNIHKWNKLQTSNISEAFTPIRTKFLGRQYGILFGKKISKQIFNNGLLSFKTKLEIMFIDIRGFTQWSSKREAHEVVRVLNKQLELISRIIHENGGVVNKILGDGILAYFPPTAAVGCVSVAIEIQKKVKANKMLSVGIGCEYGEVIIGDLGEETRLDYSLIGSAVNFASRMCSYSQKKEITITDSVFERLNNELKVRIKSYKSYEKIKVKIKPTDPVRNAIKFKPI